MTYTKTTWADEVPNSSPVKYKISQTTDGDIATNATIEMVTPVTAGTPVSASNLNHLETGVYNAQVTADTAVDKSLATAIGQILYSAAASVWAALAKPAVDSILKNTSAGALSWQPISGLHQFVPFYGGSVGNVGFNGGVVAVGEYNFASPNAFNASIPATAIALLITVSAKWASAGDGNFCNVAPTGETALNCVVCRAQTSTSFQDASGIVPMNSGFAIKVAGANTTALYITCWGYYI